MRTNFRPEQLADPHLRESEHALRTCVHCGFCTAACPTYLVLGDERDSPRGRIMLIQEMLESDAPPTPETVKHLDQCLSCLGCRTACPSGVDYSALIDTGRLHIAKHYRRAAAERALRALVLGVLTRPKLFSAALRVAHALAPFVTPLPGLLGAMAKKAQRVGRARLGQTSVPATAAGASRVGLLEGCVQQALAPAIDAAATRVLARGGLRVEPLLGAQCCGALAFHMGQAEIAKTKARAVIAAAQRAGVESVLITATGCSAFLKDYPRMFADEPAWRARAQAFTAMARDFTELAKPPAQAARPPDLVVAYHPPCSLQHAQRIAGAGEALLSAAGFNVVAIPDSHLCCGSGGSYSLLHPVIAEALRARKLAAIRSTGAHVIASGNIGCLAHLAGELPTAHIAELLDWAAGGMKPI
jgi:glycolate dehydrogenase iron-sulfur subunit